MQSFLQDRRSQPSDLHKLRKLDEALHNLTIHRHGLGDLLDPVLFAKEKIASSIFTALMSSVAEKLGSLFHQFCKLYQQSKDIVVEIDQLHKHLQCVAAYAVISLANGVHQRNAVLAEESPTLRRRSQLHQTFLSSSDEIRYSDGIPYSRAGLTA